MKKENICGKIVIQSEEEEIQINANEILDMKAENIGEVIENILEDKTLPRIKGVECPNWKKKKDINTDDDAKKSDDEKKDDIKLSDDSKKTDDYLMPFLMQSPIQHQIKQHLLILLNQLSELVYHQSAQRQLEIFFFSFLFHCWHYKFWV